MTLTNPSDTIITVTEESGGYMAKRAKDHSDLVERLKVVGSVAFFAICGLALTVLALWGTSGWIYSMVGIAILVLLFLFWPKITTLFWSITRRKPKPKRAMNDE